MRRRGQALALLAVSALITVCTAFAPVYDRAMQQALVDTVLDRAETRDLVVRVQSPATVDAGGPTEARDPRDLQALVPRDVATQLGQIVLGRTASVTPVHGDVPPTGPLVWRDGGCEHVRLLSGRCPDAPGEILVSDADVASFGLAPGSRTRVRTAVSGQTGVRLEVVGTYAPTDEAWWQGETLTGLSRVFAGHEPSAAHDAWLTTEETFLGGPVFLGETAHAGAAVRTEAADVDAVLALGDRLRALTKAVEDEEDDVDVLSDLGGITQDVRTQTEQAHRTVPLLVAPMAVLSVFVLWLVLAAATEQRRGEVAVARLRGRGRARAAGLLLRDLLPALLAGVALGAGGALLAGTVARSLLPGAEPFEVGAGFVVAVLLAAVAVVLTTVAAAVRLVREPLDALVRRGRTPSRRWSLGALDAFLLAAVGTGVLAFVTGSLSGPAALVGPALLALLAGLLLGHLATPAASAAGRWLLHRGRLVAGLTLLETGRRRETRATMAVLTVASALAVFALDAFVVGERNRVNASQHDAGAPVVLEVDGLDLDGARAALDAVDPEGQRATPVMIARDTLAVETDGFRRVASFPRGAPTADQWRAIAPPDVDAVSLTGSRVSVRVSTDEGLESPDTSGADVEVDLGLVVSTTAGTRRTIDLGPIPPPGERAMLVGDDAGCADGCRLVAVSLSAYTGAQVQGELELGDLRVDGHPVSWGSPTEDWYTAVDEDGSIAASGPADGGTLHLAVRAWGSYPVELTSAWVPAVVPALLPTGRQEPDELFVKGLDGSQRPATPAGRVVLVPSMSGGAALVDLDGITRGSQFTADARMEVWLAEGGTFVEDVVGALRERGVVVEGERRESEIRQAYDDSVPAWSLGLGAALGPAVVLVALLVLLVLAVTGWRERARDLAVLRLNGADARTTRRIAARAQLPAALLAVATGVAAGTLGAALAMRDVPFFPVPPESPVVDPATSWPTVLAVAAACVVLLPAVAAVAGRGIARRAHPERVRELG